jgi:hypothetical protein
VIGYVLKREASIPAKKNTTCFRHHVKNGSAFNTARITKASVEDKTAWSFTPTPADTGGDTIILSRYKYSIIFRVSSCTPAYS